MASTLTAPVQAALIVNAPPPVTVSAPDTTALVATYTREILPLSKYTITTPEHYIQGNIDWNKAKMFSASIDALFAQPCDLAHKAHKSLTTLRAQLKAPADQIAAHVGNEIVRYQQEQNRLRALEEKRLQAIEDARLAEERRAADAERQRLEAERQRVEAERVAQLAQIEELEDWERPSDAVIADLQQPTPVIVPAVVEIEQTAPVRLQSSVPQVIGGPRMVDKPWSCKITDPVALLKWVLESPEERIGLYVEFRMPSLNSKAKELGTDMARVIPGTEAVRDQTLKRS